MEPTSGDLRFTSHRLSDICLASEKGGRHTSSVNKPTWQWRNLGFASQRGCHFISSCQPHFSFGFHCTDFHIDTSQNPVLMHCLLG
jgi:hypothetical protein